MPRNRSVRCRKPYGPADRGDKAAAHIWKVLREPRFSGVPTAVLANNGEAIRYLQGIVRRGDAILVKGSRGMMMEEIVNALVSG